MPYIQGFDREQIMLCDWDTLVDPESDARLIDAFVDSLDMGTVGVKEPSADGRPAYDPRSLFKLYIYGCKNGIRSSRKLAKACRVNVEVMWMTGGVEPDFRTISDFRKENIDCLKKIFHEFNRIISGGVKWGFSSVDGSKFLASNSKDANFTKSKLDDRIKWLNDHTDEYLRILKAMDESEDAEEKGKEGANPGQLTREALEEKLKEARERLKKYEGYQELMEETGASQLSVTDADARLMKSKNGFSVAYNPQTAVDSETHLIRDFEMTNQVTDHGMLMPTLAGIRAGQPDGIIEAVADRGYDRPEDMASCLENGIIPHVIAEDGKDEYELELGYEEAEADLSSTEPGEIGKALRSGRTPEAYKDVITGIEVKEVRRRAYEDGQDGVARPPYGTQEQMMERAREGYFVRDPERNLVYCPGGETLRQKCVKKNGSIRYANKNACRHCSHRNQCYKGRAEWKEIDFTKDGLERQCKGWPAAAGEGEGAGEPPAAPKAKARKYHLEKTKVVKIKFKPSRAKMSQRMCLSEHPFGTIKRAMGGGYFLLRGLQKVSGEFALMCLGYNLERAKNLLGFEKMMGLMAGK